MNRAEPTAGPDEPGAETGDELRVWARSGAMFLTGRADGPPLAPPPGFVHRLQAIGEAVVDRSAAVGRRVEVDVVALLGERAALAGLQRRGDVSCGGSARLLRAVDGWLAVNLPRPDDVDLLPAWLAGQAFDAPPSPVAGGAAARPVPAGGEPERFPHRQRGQSAPAPRPGPSDSAAPGAATTIDGVAAGLWEAIAAAVATAPAEALAEQAAVLGLPVARLPEAPRAVVLGRGPFAGLPVVATGMDAGRAGTPPPHRPARPLVVDLSSLWAGPLGTHLLQAAGARVVKVESLHRPDGARYGPSAFFDLLHAGQESVALDFRSPDGRADLRRLVGAADVVVEASRPRALEQLGINAEAVLREAAVTGRGPRVWLSITGYGRAAPGRDRVAFGDDAAVAGGLVAWDGTGPCFLADAAADPCSGLVAAAAGLAALASGGRWLVDVAMSDVAAHLAGPARGHRPSPGAPSPERPRARTPAGPAAHLGEHTDALLAEFRPRPPGQRP